jgi:glutamate---cysteine ligase / carboxylate-amine ligase
VTQYSFGIEEEYFVVGRRTGNIKAELSQAFMRAASKELGSHLTKELLQSQIEVVTRPLVDAEQARQDLFLFRKTLADVGQKYGIGILAAGTHPLARPDEHVTTNKRRYTKVIKELGLVGLGNALCGLHVHVEVPDPDRRVEVMHRLVPFLPILLALSTSSPFWAGIETGLLGYRNAANDAFPRSGLPEMFRSGAEYEDYVQALTEAKIITDSTYIWWALRPSLRHPTLELRLTDCCTAVDDAVAIASLYRALVRHVVENPKLNAQFSAVARALTEENRWRAQRYGTTGTYVDVATREAKPFKQMLDETLALVRPDLTALGLEPEVVHLGRIAANGTSAHRQLAFYRVLRKAGKPRVAALKEVSRWLCSSTEVGYFVENQPRADAAWAARTCAGPTGSQKTHS